MDKCGEAGIVLGCKNERTVATMFLWNVSLVFRCILRRASMGVRGVGRLSTVPWHRRRAFSWWNLCIRPKRRTNIWGRNWRCHWKSTWTACFRRHGRTGGTHRSERRRSRPGSKRHKLRRTDAVYWRFQVQRIAGFHRPFRIFFSFKTGLIGWLGIDQK